MLVTVVLAVKDPPEKLLRLCLASFARLDNAKHIVIQLIQSGSLPTVDEEYKSAFGDFRVAEVPPQGVYAAYNHGISLAETPYVVFFGCDDIALPGMDQVLDHLASSPVQYDFYAASSYMQGTGISAPSHFRPSILFRNWCHQGLFYRSSLLQKHGYEIKYFAQADHKLNIEILSDPKSVVGYSDELVAYFSAFGVSQTRFDWEFRKDLPALATKTFGSHYGLAVRLKQIIANLIKRR